MLNSIHCTDALSLMRSLPDGSVDLILTDPPYGNTNLHFDQNFVMDWGAFFTEAWRVLREKNRPVLMFVGGMFQAEMKYLYRQWFRYEWIWEKTHVTGAVDSEKQPMDCFEFILVFGQVGAVGSMDYSLRFFPQIVYVAETPKAGTVRNQISQYGDMKPSRYFYTGKRYPKSIIRFALDPEKSQTLKQVPSKLPYHPSQKPQELLRYLLKTYTLEGDVVLDPFCGSGSTGVACATLGRSYIMGDVHEPYIETARRRVANTPYNAKEYEGLGITQPSLLEGLENG